MNEFYRELYDNLVKGIDECEKKHTNFKEHIECCFHVCESASLLADKQLESTVFDNDEERIIFFKYIRPKFRGLAEFYSIVYRAELFVPEIPTERIEFWNNELRRAEMFLESNRDFFNYLKEGDTFNDKEYFSRPDEKVPTASELIGQLTARELYVELLRKKIEDSAHSIMPPE